MKPILIYPHQGLGDHFIINGLVWSLADKHSLVMLLCRKNNLGTVKFMYSDDPRIIVVPEEEEPLAVQKIQESGGETLRLGYCGNDPNFNAVDYDQKFYAQGGVPFENRWGRFRFPAPKGSLGLHGVVAVHDDDRFSIVGNVPKPFARVLPQTDNLFDWLPFIFGAKAIHCIPSCVFLLIDSLPESGCPLNLHSYIRKDVTMPSVRKLWNMIESEYDL